VEVSDEGPRPHGEPHTRTVRLSASRRQSSFSSGLCISLSCSIAITMEEMGAGWIPKHMLEWYHSRRCVKRASR